MDQVVVFFKDRQPRILEGVETGPFIDREDCLINPEIPPGVPPHRWKLVDGKIEVLGERECVSIHNHPHVKVDHHHPAKIEEITVVKYELAFYQGLLIAAISSGFTFLFTHWSVFFHG